LNQQNQVKNEKKHNYFYKITNLINGKYYYGIRSTNKDLEKDKYFGSGNKIKNAIKKYGIENFKKEIIADYPTRKEVSNHERQVVTMELVLDKNCYNLIIGGDDKTYFTGENNPFYSKNHTEETKQKLRELNSGEKNKFYGKRHSKETKKHLSDIRKGKYLGKNSPNYGRILSQEQRDFISKSNTGRKRTQEQKEKMSKRMKENNPFKGKTHTEESKQKIRDKRKLQVFSEVSRQKRSENSKWAKPCSINGIEFRNTKLAASHFNIKVALMRNRLRSTKPEWEDWYYIQKSNL
jgi:group I intron endonuclease